MPDMTPQEAATQQFREMMNRLTGDMEDDRSRRGGRRRRRDPSDDDSQECLVKNRPTTTFEDVAGNEEAKTEMVEIAQAIRDGDAYKRFGASIPKGILMCGEPGCGKTYMVGALANELAAPFYHVQISNVTSMWFGKSEENLKKIFEHANSYVKGEIDISRDGEVTTFEADDWAANRENELLDAQIEAEESAEGQTTHKSLSEIRTQIKEEIQQHQEEMEERYAVIFFDEMDALGASRDNTPFQGGVSNRIVSVLLENMDGLESGQNILVVASTNRPEAVDPALRRAGRFDRILQIKKPNAGAREKIFDIHFRKAEEKADREFVQIDGPVLGEKTKKLVGADIAEIVRKTCQTQAAKWRDAEEDGQEELETIRTEDVLEVINDYRIKLRQKDPNNKGTMGFGREEPDQFLEDDEDEVMD